MKAPTEIKRRQASVDPDELDRRAARMKKPGFATTHNSARNRVLVCQRQYLGLTHRQLSERSGISIRTIRDYEAGRRPMGNMRASTYVSLCDALGLSLDIMLIM
jgi:DNA-binding transcriptional regulator YiaG